MLAWQIYISTEKNINEDASIDASFASWATGLGGDQWIKDLVKANKAQILKESCGYPNYYTAKAKYIIPLIIKDLPQYNGFFVIGEDYVLNGKKNWDIKLEKTKLATITPNKLLYIETLDKANVQSGYSQPLVNGIQGLAL